MQSDRINFGSLNTKSFDYPNLIEAQQNSFKWFLEEHIGELFSEINPIEDNTGKLWILEFLDYRFGDINRSVKDAVRKGLSYDRPLYFNVKLTNKTTGEIKEQELFIADLPYMTDQGSFIINGHERVVIHQIVRAEGVLFTEGAKKPGQPPTYYAKLITSLGPWLTFEVNAHNVISLKFAPKKPKILVTTLLRAFGYSSNTEILSLFSNVDTGDIRYIDSTLVKDHTYNHNDAVLDIYKKIRPDISITYDSAKAYIDSMFFNPRKMYLGKTGRYKLNKKLGLDIPMEENNYVVTVKDIVSIISRLIEVNNGVCAPDDVDSLSNRRVKSVGELLGDSMRLGIRRVEKIIKDRMSVMSSDEVLTPSMLISSKPIASVLNDFFGSSSVSVLMDQDTILSEISNKRRVTAGGPGGLTKESATFSVRDMHYSQYSRLCPVETPEGPHIGIVNHLAVYARVNEYGFIEVPYREVNHTISFDSKEIVGRILKEDLKIGGKIYKEGTHLNKEVEGIIIKNKLRDIKVFPFLSNNVEYFDVDEEFNLYIMSLNVNIDKDSNIMTDIVEIRNKGEYRVGNIENVTHAEVSSTQISGVSANLIPFMESNKAERTLMGSNMQKQAVPLLRAQSPIVGSGFEGIVARNSGRAYFAEDDGEVIYSDASKVIVKYKNGDTQEYIADKFIPTNDKTSFSQTVVVKKGNKFKKGSVLIDGPSMDNGELALGSNVTVAYMMYNGYNFEDGIVISERLVKEDILTSVHVTSFNREIKETRLGDEVMTRDIPNVSLTSLRNLDDNGIVKIGSYVKSGDILIGIVAPKGEVELTAEEKLLRSIFGEMAKDVRDNSLRMPNGSEGIVIGVEVLDRDDESNKIVPGVIRQVKIWVARTHKIGLGDKLSGRFGDKGIISKILPIEDMPYTKDGTPVDVILSPSSIIRRLNLGQLHEIYYGIIGKKLNVKFEFPIFSKIDNERLKAFLKEHGMADVQDKSDLYDGRLGEKFKYLINVGPRYIIVLDHLADSKIHARSTGHYTVVNQQPLGGKASMGGQRFGEMEVWALEAYGAADTLHETLSIKSDDIIGRSEAYKSIIHNKKIQVNGIPESFRVLLMDLKSLCLNIDPVDVILEDKVIDDEGNVIDESNIVPEDVIIEENELIDENVKMHSLEEES